MNAGSWEYRGRSVNAPLIMKVLRDPQGHYYLGIEDLPPLELSRDVEQQLGAIAGRDGA